mmetsp:Transcript_35171/g.43399  ORF Transcript_35171/g.43399 Transcript_35171/m.43399 type:complete len:334 (+) Transcript_35171:170-1171(+)|eukprot:CAMPEP_0204861304 /NCGR_PEP_ID=MMETSP1348-20121228/1445_1 /ASSEMBLY_ACC=CAM_ASM_000700 /TAXON_ID=215587 /ORGANISM="Aplanochytrium stocchinoi, Strain GSBS06" /LENGTH=333 /DNA_ID=CAMNT_0052010611 /DNA_START=41 /DNA_END=1042 /DNA_ORIENTATION=+
MVEVDISENEAALYDRQIRLWGVEAQKRMRDAKVLICGLRGTTIELCKNLILAGISVTIQDSDTVKPEDLGTQFFLREEDIGKNKVEASQARMQELNPLVEVSILVKPLADLDGAIISKFDYVCACATKSVGSLIKLNNVCRENSALFFCTDSFGLYGYLFLDLGNEYKYIETTIETPKPGEEGEEEKKIQKEQILRFSTLEEAINTKWKSLSTKKRKRVPETFFTLRTLYEVEKANKISNGNETKIEMDAVLEKLLKNEQMEPAQLFQTENVLESAETARLGAEINPVCAVMGGVVGQEVLKAISRKDKPITNFFFFDGVQSRGTVRNLPTK